MYKFYLSVGLIFLSLPYILRKLSPNKYLSAHLCIQARYQSRSISNIQIGSCLSGVSMALTGFCPSFLPIYLVIDPILFLYSIAISHVACIFYFIYGGPGLNRTHVARFNNDNNNLCRTRLFLIQLR